MTIHENAISKTSYDPDTRLLTLEFYGLMKQDLGMEQITRILEFIEDSEVWGAVADIRRLRGSFIKVFDALRYAYYPVVAKKGHRCKAIVVSDDIITEHLAAKLRDMIQEFGMEVQLFKDREQAGIWIMDTLKKYHPELKSLA
jgi:hypothetical protein